VTLFPGGHYLDIAQLLERRGGARNRLHAAFGLVGYPSPVGMASAVPGIHTAEENGVGNSEGSVRKPLILPEFGAKSGAGISVYGHDRVLPRRHAHTPSLSATTRGRDRKTLAAKDRGSQRAFLA
jgi:hypothetical protein